MTVEMTQYAYYSIDAPNIGTETQKSTLTGLPSELLERIVLFNTNASLSSVNREFDVIVRNIRTDILLTDVGQEFNSIMRGKKIDQVPEQLIRYIKKTRDVLTQEEWQKEGITTDDWKNLNDPPFNKIDTIYSLIRDKIFINFFGQLKASFANNPSHEIHQFNMDPHLSLRDRASVCREWLRPKHGANRLVVEEDFISTFCAQNYDYPPEILTQELAGDSFKPLITYACEVGDLKLLSVCIQDVKYREIGHDEWYALKTIAQKNKNHLIVEKLKQHEPSFMGNRVMLVCTVACLIFGLVGVFAAPTLLGFAIFYFAIALIIYFSINYNLINALNSNIDNALNAGQSNLDDTLNTSRSWILSHLPPLPTIL